MTTIIQLNFDELQKGYNALSDEIRLKMVKLLSVTDELCVCQFQEVFDMPQPNLSFHLRILREAGLVNSEKRGKWAYYSLNKNNPILEANKRLIEGIEIAEKVQQVCRLGS
jgi:ArsR family transcriptional regulator